ncbi:MAG: peptidylprolyl isomerase [Limnochordia bacterium]|nr:peptidylprolyl isomerase [Limnochordia bacterium]
MVFSKMRNATKVILVIVILGFAASGIYVGVRSGFGGSNQSQGRVVATVNGSPIYAQELAQRFNQAVGYENYWQSMMGIVGEVSWLRWENIRYEQLEWLISRELLVQKAKADKIKVTNAEVDAELSQLKAQYGDQLDVSDSVIKEEIRTYLPIDKLLRNLRNSIEVTDAELAAAYEEVNARHILISTDDKEDDEAKALAEELLAKAKSGEDFAALAQEYSDDMGSKDNAGELGFFKRGTMLEEFEEAAFSTAVGDYTIAKTFYGYHVINVLEHKEASGEEYEQAKESLAESLKESKTNEKVDQMLTELKKEAEIVYQDKQMNARVLYVRGEFESAIDEYKAALKATPDEITLYASLADAYARIDEIDLAIETIQSCIERLGTSYQVSEAYYVLGSYYMAKQEEDLAAEAFISASDANKYDLMLHYNLQAVLAQMGRTEELAVINQRLEDIFKWYEERYQLQQQEQQNATGDTTTPDETPENVDEVNSDTDEGNDVEE